MEQNNFSKKERNGTVLLLIIIILFIGVPFLLPYLIKPETIDPDQLNVGIKKLAIKQSDSDKQFDKQNYNEDNYPKYEAHTENHYPSNSPDNLPSSLFVFDPNTLSAEGWKKLGVRDKTILTIQKYISKGGKFYKPEDLSKIWGLQQADKLIPYVKIEQQAKSYQKKDYPKTETNGNAYTPNKKESKQPIDINTADTTAFIALPGIASKLANRIIVFRNKLGGFYKIEQIAETFGLRDSVFQIIKPRLLISNTSLTQFNINTATADEMKVHPYIHYAIANAIVQYRTQHGNFLSVTDMKKIMLITDEVYNKLAPYLKVN